MKYTDSERNEHEIPKDILASIDKAAYDRGKSQSEKQFRTNFKDMLPEGQALSGKELTEAIKGGMVAAIVEASKKEQDKTTDNKKSNELSIQEQVAKMVVENNQKMQTQMDQNNIGNMKQEIVSHAIREHLRDNQQAIFPHYIDQYFKIGVTDGKTSIFDKEGNIWINPDNNNIGTPADVAGYIKKQHPDIYQTIKTGGGANLSGNGNKSEVKVDLSLSPAMLIAAGMSEIPVVADNSVEL